MAHRDELWAGIHENTGIILSGHSPVDHPTLTECYITPPDGCVSRSCLGMTLINTPKVGDDRQTLTIENTRLTSERYVINPDSRRTRFGESTGGAAVPRQLQRAWCRETLIFLTKSGRTAYYLVLEREVKCQEHAVEQTESQLKGKTSGHNNRKIRCVENGAATCYEIIACHSCYWGAGGDYKAPVEGLGIGFVGVKGGPIYYPTEGFERPNTKVTQPVSLSSFDQPERASEVVCAWETGQAGFGLKGLELWDWKRRVVLIRGNECMFKFVVCLGAIRSGFEVTSSTKSSKPGTWLITRLVLADDGNETHVSQDLGCSLEVVITARGGWESQGGNENIAVVHVVVGVSFSSLVGCDGGNELARDEELKVVLIKGIRFGIRGRW
ncbi:hypothetical protein AG1IA_03571 [Rhizoctonia solani AG-1 IA]|uniref:Uncharacterized protein n=1 Tax=Thanatephorus cucumeris (strain AG1-IA) TaxID=983506 RepID=L8WZZ4_THACA|nr:hypothetical protein AG1IA_03571 [Rhizoctonia solani AG-1 IA]